MRFGQIKHVAKSSDQQMVNLPAVYAIKQYGTSSIKRWSAISALSVILVLFILPFLEILFA